MNVWVLLPKALQEWTVSDEGWEKVKSACDLWAVMLKYCQLELEEKDILHIINLGLAQFAGDDFRSGAETEISMADLVVLRSVARVVAHSVEPFALVQGSWR